MQYRTTCAIVFKGDARPAGSILEMDAAEAANLGDVVEAVGAPVADPEPEPEKELADMSKDELAAKAG